MKGRGCVACEGSKRGTSEIGEKGREREKREKKEKEKERKKNWKAVREAPNKRVID